MRSNPFSELPEAQITTRIIHTEQFLDEVPPPHDGDVQALPWRGFTLFVVLANETPFSPLSTGFATNATSVKTH